MNDFVSSERATLTVLDMQVKRAGLSIDELDQVFGELPDRPSRPKHIEGICCEHLEDSVQNDFIFHLSADLMTRSPYGPFSKPLSWKQLHHSVARGRLELVMAAAKELKEGLTEDRDLPSSVSVDSAGQEACS